MAIPPAIARRFRWLVDEFHADLAADSTIVENDPLGKGAVTLRVGDSCHAIAIGRHILPSWLRHKKNADFVVLRFDDIGGVHLHIFELKKTITDSMWRKVKLQAEASLLNAMAVGGVLGISTFATVTLHAAFADDELSPTESTSPVLLKYGADDSRRAEISLCDGTRVGLAKVRCAGRLGDRFVGSCVI